MTNDNGSKDTIKESLGLLETTADNFAEFAIDSDDEAELEIPLDHPPTQPSSSSNYSPPKSSANPQLASDTAISGATKTQLKKVHANDDPLNAFFHSDDAAAAATQTGVPTTTTTITNNSTSGLTPNIASKPAMGAASSVSSVSNVSNIQSNIHATYSTSAQQQNMNVMGTTPTVTQSLTSTFSSFASKFQDAVNIATTITPSMSTGYPNSEQGIADVGILQVGTSNGNMATTANYVQRSVENSISISRMPSSSNAIQPSHSFSSVNSNAPSVYSNSYIQNEQPKPQPIYQIGNAFTDMDNTLKSTLVSSAIGKLLPGERVIVFLSHLLQVKDSSSPQTSLGSPSFQGGSNKRSDMIWCCAVTFYRLILFSYFESEFAQIPQENSMNSNSSSSSSSMQQTPDVMFEMNHWNESASVSSLYQHVHRSCKRGNGKNHYVIQIPLASVDRIEKSTDFGLNSNSGISNFSAAANLINGGNTVSSNYDQVGGAVARGTLIVYGKDNGRFIQFTAASYADCMRVYESLNTYAFPGRRNLGYLFAFESRRMEVMDCAKSSEESNHLGPQNGAMGLSVRATPRRYDAIAEFRRMVTGTVDGKIEQFCPWTPVLRANSTYNLCSSYPSVMFAPRSVNDEKPEGMRLLRDTASFRSGGRMQTMSWASRFDGASIWRSAQPKVGLQGNRSPADELFMKKIAESAALANSQAAARGQLPPRPSLAFLKMLTGGINESDLILGIKDGNAFNEKCLLKIFDLRPKSSAMANRTAGYGYENTSHYKNTTLSFFGIGNIHAVRDSYKKLSSLCASLATNDVQWMQLVEDTKWLSLVRLILSASWQAAFHVRYNRLPVLVHCSHGWDRTSQVSAIAQIFLDPYYRTRAGFSCLVEKDFLALGHPLHTRCGHGEGKGSDQSGSGSSSGSSDEISPIFLQFIDCVFQIVNQYPDFFEFNTKYLLLLSEHIYSCRFGTLLCDTEREREVVASIRQRTFCLWEYLDSCPDLVNTNFSSPDISNETEILNGKGCLLMPLSSLLRNVTLWTERHCMHSAKPTFRSIPLSLYPDDLPQDRRFQPLCESKDAEKFSLQASMDETQKWKKIVQQKDEEISNLKQQLKEMKERI